MHRSIHGSRGSLPRGLHGQLMDSMLHDGRKEWGDELHRDHPQLGEVAGCPFPRNGNFNDWVLILKKVEEQGGCFGREIVC